MLFIFLFLSSGTLFISSDASDTGLCSWISPCNFQTAKQIIGDYNFVNILDTQINDSKSLNSLSDFLSCAISKNCIIAGTDTIVDGNSFLLNDLAFIHAEKGDEAKISQMTFTNFNCTLLSIRSFSKFSMTQCTLIKNEMKNSLGLIIASHTSLKIRHSTFSQNFVIDSNCIESSQSQVYFKNLNIKDNHILDKYHHFFYFINSIVECKRVYLSHFYSPYSSIFSCDYRTYFTFVDSKFSFNVASQLFSCDGIINFQFHSTSFHANTGQIMKATSVNPTVLFQYCEIRNNVVPDDRSMFDLNGGNFKFADPVVIINNQADCFIDFHNCMTLLSITMATVNLNTFSGGFVRNIKEGQIRLISSMFCLNIIGNFLCSSSHAFLLIHSTHFLNNVGKIIDCKKGILSCHFSVFNSSSAMPIIQLTELKYEKSEIVSSQFFTTSKGHMIAVESSDVYILYSHFSQSKNDVVSPGVFCQYCIYGQQRKGIYQRSTIHFALFAVTLGFGVILIDACKFCKQIS